ncbi:MAG: iron ABC transporter permease [Deltaproteobacteria bacterium]|nr:iron ABC transporter permease [Deltaproteobacteria bacterium]
MTPLAMLLYGSLQSGFMVGEGNFTIANYVDAYTDREFYSLFFNSLIYALGVSLFTVLIGTALAWICERTNTPGRGLFAVMAVTTYIIPGVLLTISWILLLSPRIGLFNNLLVNLFGFAEPPLTIYSHWGMIWTASVHLYPLNFLMMAAAFRSMDSSLEEAAWAAGANNFTCLRQITLKILRPALLSTMLILFIRGIESFEVPALIGIPARIFVFTTKIYEAASGFPPALGLAGANASILLIISILGVYLYQKMTARGESFTTITGKGFRPRIIDLGRWKYVVSGGCILFFILTLFLPVLALLGTSFSGHMVALTPEAFKNFTLDEYRFVLSYPIITRAFRNSVLLAASSATVVMLLTSVIAWITVRTTIPGKWLLDALTFIPIAIPGVIMGVSMIFVYLTLPIPIYGTLWILLVAYITLYMPYGIRVSSATMVQIHKELEEASTASGASWAQTFFRIVIPLLLPGFLSGWIYVAIISLRELSASIFLVGQGTEVLSTVVFALWDAGNITAVAALGVLMTLFLIVLALIVQGWQRRLGILRE